MASTFPEGTMETLAKMDGFILSLIGHQAYPEGARRHQSAP